MKRITPKRVALFIGVMMAVAIIAYQPLYIHRKRQRDEGIRRQQIAQNEMAARVAQEQHAAQMEAEAREIQQREAAARAAEQEAIHKAAEEHAQFLARYVNVNFAKKPGIQTVALSVSAGGKANRAIQEALARRFQDADVQLLASFFNPPFLSDGLFENAFNGLNDVPTKLELAKSLDKMLLARETVEYSTNGSELQNVITATARLDVSVVPVAGTSTSQTWTFTAAGAGFSQAAAQAMAEERLIKQITDDKRMTL